MADNIQVQCINKTDRPNPHERIRGIGGIHGGKRWWLSLADAIAGTKQGKWNLYTSVGGKSVWVHIHTHLGNEYLKTDADSLHPNNLLALPECP